MIEKLLKRVQKPTRYTGGEFGSVEKNPADVNIRYAFCFPDVYEVGMSHLGMKILYHMLNTREDTYCERVFAPWVDMEEEMRKENVRLFSLETHSPVKDFDFVGFTLQYEMSYSNIVNMLDLADIPVFSKDRSEGDPFVCAGGPCAFNSEPVADFFDIITIGEGEEVTMELLDAYKAWKASGKSRQDFLLEASKIEGIYVPSLYTVTYQENGIISDISPKTTVRKRIIKNLDDAFFPETIIVPYMDIVHDRIMLEIFRGCIRGCRFCQAGMIYRPVRERSAAKLTEIAKNLVKNTGYEEISLSSLSTSDYRELKELTDNLLEFTEKERISLALPSLRVDNFSLELMEKVQKVRKTGIVFAPEAGTQRLRDVINKNITEDDLLKAGKLIFDFGTTSVKLYFMIGLPFETIEDCVGIADLSKKLLDVYFEIPKPERPKGLVINVSASCFVPKAFTPFQWAKQDTISELHEKQRAISSAITARQISFKYHESSLSVLEGVFARGDRRLANVIVEAVKLGVKFDGWSEFYRHDLWMKAFENCGISSEFYIRERTFDEILPWDMIDPGVSKEFLIEECKKAERAEVTQNCREGCSGCGANIFEGGVCFE